MNSSWKYIFGVSLCGAMTGAIHAAQAAGPATGSAETYPSKPIRIVVGFSAGGVADIAARVVATKLAENWKQQVVVDNRPGAGSVIGTQIAASSDPNGYTMISVSAAHAAIPALYSKLPFDSVQDFAGVAVTCTGPLLMIASSSVGARSVKDLIAQAKAKPGQLNFGSAGVGSATHFAMEVFKSKAGIDIVHVPYKGVPEALTDTMTGRVQFFISPLINAMPQVKDGKVVALGVTTTYRSALLPDVPTIAESGLPGYRAESWHGLLVPAKTPRAIVAKLHREITRILQQPDARERFATLGLVSPQTTPEEFDKFIRGEIATHTQIARAANIKAE
jgi:tripartite-type tricarboxylate transporter receptor subunit TctC